MVALGCCSLGMRSLGSAGAHRPAHHDLTQHIHHSSVSVIFLRVSILRGVVGTPDITRGRGLEILAELRAERGE